MKRLMIASSLVGALLLAGSVHAQSTSTATSTTAATTVMAPDTAQLKQYVGNYAIATGDVKQLIVTVERGKLVGEAVGLGQSNLLPNPSVRDAFIVPDPNGGAEPYGTVQFGRDASGKVAKAVVLVQGMTLEGIRAN